MTVQFLAAAMCALIIVGAMYWGPRVDRFLDRERKKDRLKKVAKAKPEKSE